METFKVVCKADGRSWEFTPRPTKIVTTTQLLGLIKLSKLISYPHVVPGPGKNEICLVVLTYISRDITFYVLAGYPYGGYNSNYFIRLDELTETEKEVVEEINYNRFK